MSHMISKLLPEQLESYIRPVVESFPPADLLSQVCVPRVVETWGNFICGGYGFCYAAEVEGTPSGFLLALHTDDLISGEKHAIEYLWMVARNCRMHGLGIALFEAFEADAKIAGCYRIVCGCNSVFKRKELARMYRMRGYSLFSEAYQKII